MGKFAHAAVVALEGRWKSVHKPIPGTKYFVHTWTLESLLLFAQEITLLDPFRISKTIHWRKLASKFLELCPFPSPAGFLPWFYLS